MEFFALMFKTQNILNKEEKTPGIKQMKEEKMILLLITIKKLEELFLFFRTSNKYDKNILTTTTFLG